MLVQPPLLLRADEPADEAKRRYSDQNRLYVGREGQFVHFYQIPQIAAGGAFNPRSLVPPRITTTTGR